MDSIVSKVRYAQVNDACIYYNGCGCCSSVKEFSDCGITRMKSIRNAIIANFISSINILDQVIEEKESRKKE